MSRYGQTVFSLFTFITVLTLASVGVAPTLMPLVVGSLAAFVAHRRWISAPQKSFIRRVDLADLRST